MHALKLIALLVICAAMLGSIIYAKYRKQPRYIRDERGERQRVISWSRGQPVYTPKTWQQRVQEEVLLRRERRKAILAFLIAAGICGGLAAAVQDTSPPLSAAIIAVFAVGSLPTIGTWLPALWQEALYQLGYQGIEGAKVLDKAPKPPPGREAVEAQKAHGDARLASEAEALSLLNPRN
jgi:hypothetical protein